MRFLFVAVLLFSSVAFAEWCPRQEGRFPIAVVDLGEYKLFYFVPGTRLYDEQGQLALVYSVKDRNVFETSGAWGGSDWFTSTSYEGERNGFSCDSVGLDFEGAWLFDENGYRRSFKQGVVREVGFKGAELNCTE